MIKTKKCERVTKKLGRPKGTCNKKYKLDQHHEAILKYIGLSLSKTTIAKLVGCNVFTVTDWIAKRTDIKNYKAKPRVKK